jgi:hypothetical protein
MDSQESEDDTDNTDVAGNCIELLFEWGGLWSLVGILQDFSKSAVIANNER